MSKGNVFASDILKLIFNATAIADLAQDDASSPATTLTVALHTADPGEAGTQSTNEISYTGYARIAVARTSGGWTVTGGDPDPATVSPVANIDFGEMTAGAGGTVTHFSVGTGVANKSLYNGTVTPNIVVTNGVTPRLKTTSTVTED
jgi:hypothetical protein